MDRNISIEATGVYKSFRIPHEKTNTLKSTALSFFKKKTYTELKTANDVSFKVKKGEFFGIIGRNGCGKSTMLKILAGIYVPDKGKVKINGRLSPFLELGVGFNPELSARDNIYLNGAILGLTRKEINERFNEIVSFSELSDFLDQKLRNFSSGMQVRLAFAVAIHAHADILLIDEVLAVGDSKFQNKCYEKFREFKRSGKTIIFVSHSMGQIQEFCDRVAVLDKGKLVFVGDPKRAINIYDDLNKEDPAAVSTEGDLSDEIRYHIGNGRAEIVDVKILGSSGEMKKIFVSGDGMIIEVAYKVKEKLDSLFFGFSIYHEDRTQSIAALSKQIDPKKNKVIIKIKRLDLNSGRYYVSLGLTEKTESWVNPYDLLEKMNTFTVKSKKSEDYIDLSIVNMPMEVVNDKQ